MSRRKQARPIRHLEEDGAPAPTALENPPSNPGCLTPDSPNESDDILRDLQGGDAIPLCPEDDDVNEGISAIETELAESGALMCPRCQEQFTEVPEFLAHKEACARKAQRHHETAHSDLEDMVVSEEDEDDEEQGGKRLEQVRRHRQDAANNNSVEDGTTDEAESARLGLPFPVPAAAGHVTLEALQNTKVAVAQFAATTMANNADNEAALQELAVLQSTLFTLQHQQVFQLQLINQLQQQLSLNRSKEGSPVSPSPELPTTVPPPADSPAQPQPISREPTPASLPPPISQPMAQQPPLHHPHQQQQMPQQQQEIIKEPMIPSSPIPTSHSQIQPPHCSISSAFASSIITNHEPAPALDDQPNTLEMLQKRAQEVLDNASQGLLANNLADELAFRKSKGSMSPYDSKSGRNEPFFKHRCRYCGKVFGSDSALQIHIRSHTGERPFKCNVCGSRFTTKGNLKVHFQRHTAKFPHIKMNPNPVPEHLDKYHPPLLAQLGQQPSLSPAGPPHHPGHHGFPGGHPFPPTSMPLYRPPGPHPDLMNNRLQPSPHRAQDIAARLLPPHPLFMRREEQQDMPENLSKPLRSPTPTTPLPDTVKSELTEDKRDLIDESRMSNNVPIITPKQEMDTDNEPEPEPEPEQDRFSSPTPYEECSMDSKYSNEDLLGRRSPGMDQSDNNLQDEPENLSNKSNSVTAPLSISTGQRLPASFPFTHASSPPSSTSSGSLGPFSTPSATDPARDPALYTSLLPRPGSNDNSWESLIEVTKTSETSKLQQLVDNIEHKLTDPNQCVICHRVLSCKSALQMHYRTHTGERPFKCKICGRAFTTKGNLKTHMGVHRAKPPMRVLHQCPVCHKKFTNALVLQQHIRLHTGEPTDLTPEQIQAAEIKDYPSPGAFPPLPNSMNPFLGPNFPLPGLSPLGPGGMPLGMKPGDLDMKNEQDFLDDDDDDDDDDLSSTNEQQGMPSFSTSLAALENQVRTITTMASQLSASGLSCSPEDLCPTRMTSTPTQQNGEKSPTQSGITSPGGSEVRSSPNQIMTPVQVPRPPSSQQPNSPSPSESNSLGALDLTPRSSQPAITSPGPSPGQSSLFSNFGLLPPGQGAAPLMSSALSSLTSSVLTSTAFSPLGLAVGPTVRGNTTCNICFKTFACNSALEIHYRSHTKERPFKCTVCDRGFSTKGNGGCHCGHWRIQDGGKPRRVRTPSSSLKISFPPLMLRPGYATACGWTQQKTGNMKQHMLTHKIRDMPQHMFDKPSPIPGVHSEEPPMREPHPEPELSLPPPPPEINKEQPAKRAPSETELPLPKRPPSVAQASKHLCHVCNKNFSSSSALQIHMRTHTGDKPFRCTVCQKAFTTKGNLKVHMGTHMWSNGASRRGRRMSLDLPPIPMTPKDSEFLQRRPDLFYPYLPAPFLNGMQQKLNEISVIQNAQNGLVGSGKYSGLLGFGYPPPDALRPGSPLSERTPSRPPSREPERLWDLHKAGGETAREDLSLPGRGEGLAA